MVARMKVALMALIITVTLACPVYAQDITVNAEGAVLMDANSGKIIFEQDSHKKVFPASITKIMTLLIAMEKIEEGSISLDDQVVISGHAAGMGGSQLYMEPGETKTVEQLLKAITIASANDASVALAEHIAGTEDLFVEMMNQRAKELGMNDTNFVNSNGLHDDNHYTSANDVAIMSRELLKHKKIFEWTTTWMEDIKVGKEGRFSTITMVNTNKLLRRYEGVDGLKTGYTTKAKHCISATATRGNLRLIAVIMGAPTSQTRFKEAEKLLNYGFARYTSVVIAKEDDIVNQVKIAKGKEKTVNIRPERDVTVLVEKGKENTLEREVKLPEFVNAPVKEGQKIGELIVKQEGEIVERVNLVAQKTIEKAGLLETLWRMMIEWIVPAKYPSTP